MYMEEPYITSEPGEEWYTTRDLYEATALHSLRIPLEKVTRDHNGVCFFNFGKRRECEKVVTNFRNRELMVNAKDFCESLRAVKDFIYNNTEMRR